MGVTQAGSTGETDASERDAADGVADDGLSSSSSTDSPAVADPSEETLTEDELFEILSNRRRRHVLHELMQEDGGIDIGTLSEEIAAYEDGLELHEVSSSDRKRVYTALHQSHLPKMDEAGVLEFNKDRGTVEPTPALEDVEIYMDVVRGREIPWSDYYIGLTALSGILLGVTALGPGPLAALTPYAWGVFVLVSFGVSAMAHRYYARRNRLGIADDPPDVALEYQGPDTEG
ncbi:hypothetical protein CHINAEXTREME_06370 [Halobiforma lacisalsi AJ5]|uniref:DUF7344 domain-containing protein n=1 Tax=Natronobacterium lacisalsi AJ5 TaxID=358396 RepID=M0LXV7_NATLA|nr:hypothetical protein [Halobiforma lacisalsi]APW97418.1 hypothetical protein CHINAEXTREME_06370 [Halobiforma lacisalsi AJ5]EMA38286.1 hypothetical protein C445_00255 [Halobiforma lacisalsi AJ5]